MSIDPILKSVLVRGEPERAFRLFVTRMGTWWPRPFSIGAAPLADVVMEPFAGGRWFERDAAGAETDWGRVIAYEPPERLLLGWQVTSAFRFDPGFETEVEVRFAPADGGTQVTLEHRTLERYGADARRIAEQMGGGWPRVLALFAELNDSVAADAAGEVVDV